MAENPTSVFPDISMKWDLSPSYLHNTTVVRARSGRTVRQAEFGSSGLMRFSATTGPLDQVNRRILKDFMQARRGQFDAFYFFRTDHENYLNVNVGSKLVSGATTLTVPFKGIQSTLDETPAILSMTVGGTPVAFSISAGTGPFGEDVISWGAGVTQTGIVLMTMSARQRYTVIFEDDEAVQSFIQNAANFRASFNIALIEAV